MKKDTTITPKRPIIQISLPESEKAIAQQRSKELGMSLSDFCRTVLNQYSEGFYRKQKAVIKN